MVKVLLIEDDFECSSGVKVWLTKEKHVVEVVELGTEGLERLRFYPFDVAIIDWMLPDLSGLEVCKRFRASGGRTPILMLTGKLAVEDKVAGLDAGADDYLTKPFHLKELSARLQALLRRPSDILPSVLCVGSLELDPKKAVIKNGDKEIKLLPKEYALMEFLMRHPDQVFSPDTLLDRVWTSTSEVSRDLVKVYIQKLRNKIDIEGQPSSIKNIHGVGYILSSEEGE